MNKRILAAIILSTIPLLIYSQENQFTQHMVDRYIYGIHRIKIIDMDGDGDFDIVGGTEHTPYNRSVGIVWWENQGGYPIQWSKTYVDENFLHVMSIDVAYIDDDEYLDIIASSWENGKISWWKNSGDPKIGWEEKILVSNWANSHDARCYDIDNDGDQDIIAAKSLNGKISIFYNDGSSDPIWTESLVSSFDGAKVAFCEDLNNDGFLDIIAAADVDNELAWWKNLGGDPPYNFEKQNIGYIDGCSNLRIADINQDNKKDILASGWRTYGFYYWLSDDINNNTWTRQYIPYGTNLVNTSIGNDIDQDGDIDIIVTGQIPGSLSVFYNNDQQFTQTDLVSYFPGGTALEVFDIDQDGDDDIIAGSALNNQLIIFENEIISVGISENAAPNHILFPNPIIDRLNFQFEDVKFSEFEIEITNLNNQIILKKRVEVNGNDLEIVLPKNLNSGLYFYKIKDKSTIHTGKFIKN